MRPSRSGHQTVPMIRPRGEELAQPIPPAPPSHLPLPMRLPALWAAAFMTLRASWQEIGPDTTLTCSRSLPEPTVPQFLDAAPAVDGTTASSTPTAIARINGVIVHQRK